MKLLYVVACMAPILTYTVTKEEYAQSLARFERNNAISATYNSPVVTLAIATEVQQMGSANNLLREAQANNSIIEATIDLTILQIRENMRETTDTERNAAAILTSLSNRTVAQALRIAAPAKGHRTVAGKSNSDELRRSMLAKRISKSMK